MPNDQQDKTKTAQLNLKQQSSVLQTPNLIHCALVKRSGKYYRWFDFAFEGITGQPYLLDKYGIFRAMGRGMHPDLEKNYIFSIIRRIINPAERLSIGKSG